MWDRLKILQEQYINQIILVTLILFCLFYSVSAQQNTGAFNPDAKTLRIYQTWISFINQPNTVQGVLYAVNDSSIDISNSLLKEDYLKSQFNVSKINYRNISTIKIRRKNSTVTGSLVGAAAGLVIGSIICLASVDDPPGMFFSFTANEKALMIGSAMAIGGAGIGAVEASIKIRIPINGNLENFNKNKNRLRKYSIRRD